MDIRLEWTRRANQIHKLNPSLSYEQVVKQLKTEGYPRPTGVEQKGFRGKGEARHPVWGKKTRSKKQSKTRKQHEQTSTDDARDHIQQLREWQETINNMAAYAGMEGAHHEHYAPSDMSDVFGDEGAPGDYVDNMPKSFAKWKTAVEQFNRTKRRDSSGVIKYRLLQTPFGARIVDQRFADARVDALELPGIDVDESMDVERIFSALPIIVKENLSLTNTSSPGLPPLLPELFRSPKQPKYTPPTLPGYMQGEQSPPTLPPTPQTDLPKQVFDYRKGNGNGNGNGGYLNGNGNGGNGFIDGLTSTASVVTGTALAIGSGLLSLTGDLFKPGPL
tara:strand:+ start:1137 stop:2135 length:999 start_codon:yes stop_codon:yes gene_type:complete